MADSLDYTAMSGAEFQRAVGVDPEKWAEAFEQRMGKAVVESGFSLSASRESRTAYMVDWFRDAMDAARADERRTIVDILAKEAGKVVEPSLYGMLFGGRA